MRISDWSSDVCSSDLRRRSGGQTGGRGRDCRSVLWRHRQRLGIGLVGGGRRDGRLAIGLAFELLGRLLPLGERALFGDDGGFDLVGRSEEHTSELQSLMRISYAVFCLKKKKKKKISSKRHTT